METDYTLQELIEAVSKGDIKEGDTFETTSGKVIYSDKKFSWISERGFILNPLQVSFETLHLTYKKLVGVKEIEFTDVLPALNKGQAVTVSIPYIGEDRIYIVEEESDLDDLIHKYWFTLVYNSGRFFVDLPTEEAEPVVDDTATKVKNYQKLTYADAYNINVYFNEKQKSALEIAEQYGISDRMVYYIAQGRYWADAHKQYVNDCVLFNL